ncbi:10 kDa chaperonin [Asimina triloba]
MKVPQKHFLRKGAGRWIDQGIERGERAREMAKRLLPSFNRVLVERILPPSKTSSGIILPEKTTKLNSGKVVAVGPGGRNKDGKHVPVPFKEGDTVLLPEYGGTQVKIDDKEYPIIPLLLSSFHLPLFFSAESS